MTSAIKIFQLSSNVTGYTRHYKPQMHLKNGIYHVKLDLIFPATIRNSLSLARWPVATNVVSMVLLLSVDWL